MIEYTFKKGINIFQKRDFQGGGQVGTQMLLYAPTFSILNKCCDKICIFIFISKKLDLGSSDLEYNLGSSDLEYNLGSSDLEYIPKFKRETLNEINLIKMQLINVKTFFKISLSNRWGPKPPDFINTRV